MKVWNIRPWGTRHEQIICDDSRRNALRTWAQQHFDRYGDSRLTVVVTDKSTGDNWTYSIRRQLEPKFYFESGEEL